MKVTFYSNFLNHHQLPLANALYTLFHDKYRFVATDSVPIERLKLGYEDLNHCYPYVVTTYDSCEGENIAKKLALESDVVIIGSTPDDSIAACRLPTGKLTFHSGERYFKSGIGLKHFLHNFASSMKHIRRFQKYTNYNYLCMSAYTAADVSMFANYKGRMFKWGYFPEVKDEDLDVLFSKRHAQSNVNVLWVGRLIPLKHPEASIFAAEYLKKKNIDFHLSIIGIGPMEQHLRCLIKERNLLSCVSLLGAMSPTNVRKYMEEADVFLFTSDFNEGWGAVLNEAMNSACAVIGSHAIGSVPFLIENKENGLIYENGNQDQLNQLVLQLALCREKREKLGRAAYATLKNEWNARVAAERFLKLVEHIQNGKKGSPFKTGPCSEAEILKNGWFSY